MLGCTLFHIRADATIPTDYEFDQALRQGRRHKVPRLSDVRKGIQSSFELGQKKTTVLVCLLVNSGFELLVSLW